MYFSRTGSMPLSQFLHRPAGAMVHSSDVQIISMLYVELRYTQQVYSMLPISFLHLLLCIRALKQIWIAAARLQ